MAHNRCYRSLINLLPDKVEQPLHGALTIQYYIYLKPWRTTYKPRF